MLDLDEHSDDDAGGPLDDGDLVGLLQLQGRQVQQLDHHLHRGDSKHLDRYMNILIDIL